ncbi:MAG: glycoside hydrolase family 5 protein [Rhodoferax sp.]|nr:glycoside hydrolase family 5 protein [Rhodoferax sp.]
MTYLYSLAFWFFLGWATLAHGVCLDPQLKGVNLAGAEFGAQKLPGVLGRDYIYPTQAEMGYFRATGMNVIRLPIRWERIQRQLYGRLDSTELAQINQVLGWARDLKLCVLLDIHNYASYHGQPLGTAAVPAIALENVWLRLAQSLPDHNSLAIGLMNEPASMRPSHWLSLAQATVLALRRAGSRHLILVGSGRWSGAHEFDVRVDGPSAAEVFANFRDPLKRFAVELHQYADANYSGSGSICIDPGSLQSIMQTLANWSRQNRVRLFMGEFGVPNNPDCLIDLLTLLRGMEDKPVWLGWTYWAAGPWWGNYALSIQPGGGISSSGGPPGAQLSVLRNFLKP